MGIEESLRVKIGKVEGGEASPRSITTWANLGWVVSGQFLSLPRKIEWGSRRDESKCIGKFTFFVTDCTPEKTAGQKRMNGAKNIPQTHQGRLRMPPNPS